MPRIGMSLKPSYLGTPNFLLETSTLKTSRRPEMASRFFGSSVRVYNPDKSEWTIYWVDSNNHEVLPQVTGTFNNGVGEFFGNDEFNGEAVKLRFLWKDITANSAIWEQAYFDKGTEEWEINWIMEFASLVLKTLLRTFHSPIRKF